MLDNRTLFVGGIRAAIGAGLVVAPRFAGRLWAGEGAEAPTARMFARVIGVRDLVLGAALLKAARDGEDHRTLLALGVAADAADVAGALLTWQGLSRGRRVLVPAAAGAVAALGYLAGKALDDA